MLINNLVFIVSILFLQYVSMFHIHFLNFAIILFETFINSHSSIVVDYHSCSFIRAAIVELHLSEHAEEQTVYIIGVRIIRALQLSPLPNYCSHNRSSCSDK